MLSLKAFWLVRTLVGFSLRDQRPDEGHAIPSVVYYIYLSIRFRLLLISYYMI